jgi:hypothetical protein
MSLSELRSSSALNNPINTFNANSMNTSTSTTNSLCIGTPSSAGFINYVETTVTGLQMMTAFTTPVLILPAQGPNTVIQPLFCAINFICDPTGTIAQIGTANLQYGSEGGNTNFLASAYSNPYNGSNVNGYSILLPGNTSEYAGFPLQTSESASSVMINQPIYVTTDLDTPSGTMTGNFIFKMWYLLIPTQ